MKPATRETLDDLVGKARKYAERARSGLGDVAQSAYETSGRFFSSAKSVVGGRVSSGYRSLSRRGDRKRKLLRDERDAIRDLVGLTRDNLELTEEKIRDYLSIKELGKEVREYGASFGELDDILKRDLKDGYIDFKKANDALNDNFGNNHPTAYNVGKGILMIAGLYSGVNVLVDVGAMGVGIDDSVYQPLSDVAGGIVSYQYAVISSKMPKPMKKLAKAIIPFIVGYEIIGDVGDNLKDKSGNLEKFGQFLSDKGKYIGGVVTSGLNAVKGKFSYEKISQIEE